MKKLNDELKGNSKLCMFIMAAVANGCEKVITNTFKDDYLQNIAKTAATVKFDLSSSDKTMFAELLANALEQEKDTVQNRCISVGSRINKLEAVLLKNITSECNTALEQLIELTELSRIDKISAEDARRLTLWFVLSQILHETDMCAETLNNASSYKKKSKKKDDEKQTAKKAEEKPVAGDDKKEPDYETATSDDIMSSIQEGKFKGISWNKLPGKVKSTISGIKDFIMHEYDSLDDTDKVTTMESFFKCKEDDKVAFVYNVLIVSLHDHITQMGGTADEFVLDVLQYLPRVFIALNTSKAEDVNVYELIEDIGRLGHVRIKCYEQAVTGSELEQVSAIIVKGLERLRQIQQDVWKNPAMQKAKGVLV